MDGELRPFGMEERLRGARELAPWEQERFPGSNPNLEQFVKSLYDTGLLDLIAPGGGVNTAISGLKPAALKALRLEAGPKRIAKLAKFGLPRLISRHIPAATAEKYYPNIQLTPDELEVMRIIQERWPRTFGFVGKWSDVDQRRKIISAAGSLFGQQSRLPGLDKYSRIEVSPEASRFFEQRQGLKPSSEFADTVAHELLHASDQIRLGPKFEEAYGIDPTIWEERAEQMGARGKQIVEAVRSAGGAGVRARTGKNVRVK